MQASRASSRAVQALASCSKQTRNLHMTGPATFSSVLAERPALNLPRNLAGLRAECHKRQLPASGTKEELISRLSAHELAHARGFSTALEDGKRPTLGPNEADGIRHFNTSRSMKAVKDNSTIDFAYIPDFDPDTNSSPIGVRVPILPQTEVMRADALAEETEAEILLPNIHTVSADSTHIYAPSAMAEVHDNNTIDFQGMASQVASSLSGPAEESTGMVRQIWNDLMDDVLGPKRPGPAASG